MILETFNLSKKYQNQYAVKDVNMHIKKGDIYGFVGENGAGKTTIIRLILGLASPTSGSFSLYDTNNKDKNINKVKEKINGIVEKVSLNTNYTALENLKYQCIFSNKHKTDNELKEILKDCGLDFESIKNKKVRNFSLGMRQRLGIAQVMVTEPEFIILDEPMNGLDPRGFIEVREAILNLHKKGATFLISSHILSELDKVCNKIGFISHGKLIEELSIDELHKKSQNKIIIKSTNIDSVYKTIDSVIKIKDYEIIGDSITIYDNLDINRIIKILSENNVSITSINLIEENIEDYYTKVIGGKNND